MNNFFTTALLLGWIALTGCATYHAKPLSPAETVAAFEARNFQDLGLKNFLEQNLKQEITPWPPKNWDFEKLTLVAFYYHPDMDVARAKWGVAKAGVITAGGHPNPTLSFIPEYVSNVDFGNSPWLAGIIFDIPIETAGKRGYRMAQAKHQSEMSQLNMATVAWQVRSRLRKSLLSFYIAREGALILQQQLNIQKENLELLEKRSSNNFLSPLALTEAQLQFNQTLLSLHEAQKQEAEARVQVATALGLPVTALQGIDLSLKFLEHLPQSLPSSDLRREALFNRADILAGLAEYAASESALQLEIAKQYPDIHLGPGYTFDQGQNKWIFGFSFAPPLFNRNKGPIAEADAHRTETAARFKALQTQIMGEIDQSLAGYTEALKKLEAANALVTAQKKKQKIINNASRPGELRRVASLQAQIEMDASTLTYLNTFANAQQSLGLLEDAVQRPLP